MIERRLTRFDFMLFSNISEDDLIINSEFRKGGILYYDVSSLNRGIRCTNCGTYHTSVKEYITKKITHFIYQSDPCVIIFHHRRFICPNTHFGVTAILCVLLERQILILLENILRAKVDGIHPID